MSYNYRCEKVGSPKEISSNQAMHMEQQNDHKMFIKSYVLHSNLSEELRKAGKNSKDAIYIMFLAGYLALQQKYENEDIERVIVVNLESRILPLILSISQEDSFLSLIKLIKSAVEEVKGDSDNKTQEQNTSRYSQVGYEKLAPVISFILTDEQIQKYEPQYKEQLYWRINIEESVITVDIQSYSKDIDSIHLDRYFRHISMLLTKLLKSPKETIREISILTDVDTSIIQELNSTEYSYPQKLTVPEIITNTVKLYGDKPAVFYRDAYITYKQLDEKSNKLAHRLREWGVTPNCIVGLMIDRSFEMLGSIISIIKAGGAYLPILPSYPSSRVAYMLSDCNVKLVLTSTKYSNVINNLVANTAVNQEYKLENIRIIDVDDSTLYEGKTKQIDYNNSEDDLLYIIYTSGSTGKPKGVQITHRALINRIFWMQKKYPIDNYDVIMQKTSYCFDVSVWELLWGCFSGSALYMLDSGDEANPDNILAGIAKYKISVMHFVPSMLAKFMGYIENNPKRQEDLKSLRYLFNSGEKLLPSYVNRFYENCVDENNTCLIVNLYGPTEAAIDVTYYDCSRKTDYTRIPIGKPIDNIKIYVVDNNMKVLPIGVPGELCISGVGLAKGYQNKEELTKEKFVILPEINQRVYRSGDLVRWLDDGNIEYLSRNDQQVKIRGYRIELGEIETALVEHSAIAAAVVIVRKNGEIEYLCAYVVKKVPLSWGIIKEYLTSILPNYMVPNYFIQIDEIPVTSNGKLNKRALEEYPLDFSLRYDMEPLITEKEKEIASIWSEILPNTEFYRNDNFFDVGGTSLDMIAVFNKLDSTYKGLTIQDLYVYDTIKALAEILENLDVSNLIAIEKMDFEEIRYKTE